jgi:hypothetical protein
MLGKYKIQKKKKEFIGFLLFIDEIIDYYRNERFWEPLSCFFSQNYQRNENIFNNFSLFFTKFFVNTRIPFFLFKTKKNKKIKKYKKRIFCFTKCLVVIYKNSQINQFYY